MCRQELGRALDERKCEPVAAVADRRGGTWRPPPVACGSTPGPGASLGDHLRSVPSDERRAGARQVDGRPGPGYRASCTDPCDTFRRCGGGGQHRCRLRRDLPDERRRRPWSRCPSPCRPAQENPRPRPSVPARLPESARERARTTGRGAAGERIGRDARAKSPSSPPATRSYAFANKSPFRRRAPVPPTRAGQGPVPDHAAGGSLTAGPRRTGSPVTRGRAEPLARDRIPAGAGPRASRRGRRSFRRVGMNTTGRRATTGKSTRGSREEDEEHEDRGTEKYRPPTWGDERQGR